MIGKIFGQPISSASLCTNMQNIYALYKIGIFLLKLRALQLPPYNDQYDHFHGAAW